MLFFNYVGHWTLFQEIVIKKDQYSYAENESKLSKLDYWTAKIDYRYWFVQAQC